MSSKSLLSNKSFNRLAVNRLDALSIRSDNISSASPSFLYSILFNFATFKRNDSGGQLIIGIDQKTSSVIQFSDRPFRQQKTITLYDFILLFFVNQQNSFSQDPPNVVLTHSNEQRTYKMTFSSINEKQLVYNLELLPGETHNLSDVSGRISLFVDNQNLYAKEAMLTIDDLNLPTFRDIVQEQVFIGRSNILNDWFNVVPNGEQLFVDAQGDQFEDRIREGNIMGYDKIIVPGRTERSSALFEQSPKRENIDTFRTIQKTSNQDWEDKWNMLYG